MGTLQEILGILNKTDTRITKSGELIKDAVTSSELRFVRRFWHSGTRFITLPKGTLSEGETLQFSLSNVTFYQNAKPLSTKALKFLGFY